MTRPFALVIVLLVVDMVPTVRLGVFRPTILSDEFVQCVFLADATETIIVIIVAEFPSFDLLTLSLGAAKDDLLIQH